MRTLGCIKIKKRRCDYLLLCLILFVSLVGCAGISRVDQRSKIEETDSMETEADTVIVTVGEQKVLFSEVVFYLLTMRQQYAGYFGEQIWTYDFGEGKTFEEFCKEDVINEVVQLKIITQEAEKQGIVVTDDEIDEIADTVKEQLNEISGADRAKYWITQESLESIYQDNYLSSKMFDIVTGAVDTEVSDEEARQVAVDYVLILTDGVDKSGNTVSLDEAETLEAQRRAEDIREKALDTENFEQFAQVYSDIDEVSMTFGRGDQSLMIEDTVFAMEVGSVSEVVKAENGFYIFYLVSDFDEDATVQEKEEIIVARQDQKFQQIYEEWESKYKVDINTKVWDKISIEGL